MMRLIARRMKIATMILLSLILVSFIGTAPALADAKNVWTADFGGLYDDVFVSVLPTADNGFVAVGYSKSYDDDLYGMNKGAIDAFLVKYDENGAIAWKKTFGGSNDDYFLAAQKTPDDGFVAAGYTYSNDGDLTGLDSSYKRALLVKYDADGNVVLKKTYRPYSMSNNNCFSAVQQTSDGGFIAAGYTWSSSDDALLVKFDETGNVTWTKTFYGSSPDYFVAVQQTSDNGYIAAGYTSSSDGALLGLGISGYDDAILVKYDENGNVTWKKKFGGSDYDGFTAIQQTTDGGFIAAGYSKSTNGDLVGLRKGDYDAVLVKYNANGDKAWAKTFGGLNEDRYASVQQTSDGGFIAGGSSYSNDQDLSGLAHGSSYYTDGILVKYDSSGTVTWKKDFGGSSNDYFYSARETVSGFIAVGSSNSPSNGDYESIAVRYDVIGSITINGLPGAVYQITQNGGIVNDNVCIGPDGTATVTDMVYGTYSIAEKTPPTGFVLNTTEQTASITHEGQVVSLTYSDEPIRGSIKVTGRPGGVYRIMQGGTVIVDDITIPAGGSFTENDLVYGTYSVVEVSPAEGYLPIPVQDATIMTDGETVSLTFANAQIKGNVKIIGDPGAKFQIKRGNMIVRDNIVIPAAGTYTATAIAYGSYTVAEIAPAVGQYLNATPQPADIAVNGQLITLDFTLKGSITIYGAPGTILQIIQYDSVLLDNVTIPAAGAITKTLYLGSYSVLEKAPAQGYLPNSAPQNAALTNPSQSISITFTNELAHYTVSFDSRGGSPVDSQSVVYNETANMPAAPTRPDCTFAGWYKEAACTTAWNFSTDKVTADMTLYARWTVAITFDSQGGSVVADVTANYDTTITAPAAPTRTGYTFGGWFTQADCTTPWSFASGKVMADTTLYAKWTINTYTVTFDSQGGSAVADKTEQYGKTITAPAVPTRTGHTFGGWYKQAACTTAWDFDTEKMTANITLYAKWIPNIYTVTFDSHGGSPVSSIRAEYGSRIAPPPQPVKTGYRFAGWYCEAENTNNWDFNYATITKDTTLYAKWAIIQYAITATTNNTAYGSVSGGGSIAYGTPVTVKATPKTGYRFVRWMEGSTAVFTSASYTFPVTRARTLKAEFAPISYAATLSTNNTAWGTVSGGGSIAYGTSATVKATPKAGYRFVRWMEGSTAVSTSASYTFTVTKERTLKAEFAPISYAVTLSTNNTAWGTVSGGGSFSSGTSATVKAAPKAGYRFARWLEGTTAVSTSPSFTFTVTKARTLKAEFAKIGTPTVKAASAGYNSVELTWAAVTGATKYEVYRATSSSGTYTKLTETASTSYTSTGLTTGTTYYFKVRVKCAAGATTTYGGYSAVVPAKPVPATPAVKAASASYSSVKLTWGAVTGASGYEVYRATSSSGTYSKVATITSGSTVAYTNTGLTTGAAYYYKVRAYRTVGSAKVYGGYSAIVPAKPVPATPAGAKAARVSSSSVKVSWSAVAGAAGYEVYRATASGGSYTLVKSVTTLNWTNTGLTTGKTYYYKVRAYRTVGGRKVYGGYSAVVSAKP